MAGLTLLVASNGAIDSEGTKLVRSTPVLDGYQLELLRDTASIEYGQQVFWTVRLINSSSSKRQESFGEMFSCTVVGRTVSGKVDLQTTSYGELLRNSTELGNCVHHEIEPGKSLDYTLWLNRLYDLSRATRYTLAVRWQLRSPTTGEPMTLEIGDVDLEVREPSDAFLTKLKELRPAD